MDVKSYLGSCVPTSNNLLLREFEEQVLKLGYRWAEGELSFEMEDTQFLGLNPETRRLEFLDSHENYKVLSAFDFIDVNLESNVSYENIESIFDVSKDAFKKGHIYYKENDEYVQIKTERTLADKAKDYKLYRKIIKYKGNWVTVIEDVLEQSELEHIVTFSELNSIYFDHKAMTPQDFIEVAVAFENAAKIILKRKLDLELPEEPKF